MNIRLDGRVALITGGSSGLGFAMAQEFLTNGAKVAIVARGAEALTVAVEQLDACSQGNVVGFVADVATAEGTQHAFDATVKAFGQVDVLVNNAGKAQTGSFEEASDEIWQADIDLKLFAAIRLSRLALPGMKQRKWGRIINVLNTQAKAPKANSAPTSVTRAAGMALTKVLANEGAPYNVLVNSLLVGLIESDQWKRLYDKSAKDKRYSEFLQDLGGAVPLGRIGKAEEFASLAAFLASEAGGFVTGTAINVDGGQSPVV
ncbi:SDR family oxidoreductase [Xylophilus sp. GW821-FHT01B05]